MFFRSEHGTHELNCSAPSLSVDFSAHSTESGRSVEKEAEETAEEPQKKVRVQKPSKAKKEKRSVREGGLELWNELDVQRNKFMVCVLHLSTSPELHAFKCTFERYFIVIFNVNNLYLFYRIIFRATSTTSASWRCSLPSP